MLVVAFFFACLFVFFEKLSDLSAGFLALRPFLRCVAAVLAEASEAMSAISLILNLRPETESRACLNVFPFFGVEKHTRLAEDFFTTT